MASDSASLIAQRYARALFSLGADARALPALEKDLQMLARWIQESNDFRRLLSNPLLSRGMKAAVLEKLGAKAHTHALTVKFLRRLALNRRLALLPAMLSAFEARLRENRGEVLAEVSVAQPLSSIQQAAIAEVLARATGKRVAVSVHMHPALLGGMRIRMGGMEIDATLAGKLARLSQTLKHAA